jgi:hypothetical protein
LSVSAHGCCVSTRPRTIEGMVRPAGKARVPIAGWHCGFAGLVQKMENKYKEHVPLPLVGSQNFDIKFSEKSHASQFVH